MAEKTLQSDSVHLFFSYSHTDELLRDELETHLSILRRQRIVSEWHDRRIAAGSEWSREINDNLESAQVILLLISPDFVASDYCYDIEMARALEKHNKGEARVIPIIVRPVDWSTAPFAKLQALPRDGKAVITWDNKDEAWLDVAKGIRRICEEILSKKEIPSLKKRVSLSTYQLFEVFKSSGVPTVTFVEPENFGHLKLALAQPGRGVVVEGPSGIGKTTALKNAIEQLSRSGNTFLFNIFSARRPDDVKALLKIEDWHKGIVIIDDFHRLDKSFRDRTADYLKYLADNEIENKKLIIVGIPSTGRKLVDVAFDLAMRVEFFRLGKVKDELIIEMIEKGEQALNITFDRKAEIVRAASGSLNIAQLLCFHVSVLENINNTQLTTKIVSCNLEKAISLVMDAMTLKFREFVRQFSSLGGHNDWTCIELLQELANAEHGVLSIEQIKDIRPDLEDGIELLLSDRLIDKLYKDHPEWALLHK